MNKFYGGGGTERCGGRALPVTGQHCKASAIAERRDQMLRMADPMPASTFHGPNREGLSGERVPPDPGSTPYAGEQSAPDWRYFTQHDYASLAGGF